jgi:hypothetical protein
MPTENPSDGLTARKKSPDTGTRRAACLGFYQGWGQCADQLAALVEKM